MKIEYYWICAPLLLTACGEGTSEPADISGLEVPEIEVAQMGGSNAEKIARAEKRHGKPFHQMSLEERAEVLAVQDIFGNNVRASGRARPISRAERREILRREEAAGY